MKRLAAFVAAVLTVAALRADNQPSVVHLVNIDYPFLAHTTGVQGTVKFVIIIDTGGGLVP